jgi:adenine deaminase
MKNNAKLITSLVDVAMGRSPADLVIRDGQWVCVQSGEIIPHTDIAVKGGHVAYVGPDAAHTIGDGTQVIEAQGRFLVPGLLDGHMHVESAMLTITELVRAVARRGTTGIFIDPHEITNVLGLRGVELMVNEAARQPIHVWVQMPSCVPSAPGLETGGQRIGPDEVSEAMSMAGIIGLGEMMNFPGVIDGDQKMLEEIAETRKAGKVVGGHYASPDLGRAFHAYAAGGAEDDHEGTRVEDAVARARQGMKPMLRYGSAWHDVAAQVGAITQQKLDSRHFILCTDDAHAQTLASEGHMDRVLRHAIEQGLEPLTAIQMMTLNTAEHFGVAREVGMIAPGRWADVVVASDLRQLRAEIVIAKGQIIAEQGTWKTELPAVQYPAWVTQTIKLRRPVQAADFALKADPELGECPTANVIGVIENQAPTRHLRVPVQVREGQVRADIRNDLAKLALLERHHGTSRVSVALVSGFGFSEACAIGSTVAHDSHNMIIVGTDDESMVLAANTLAACGGGQVAVKDAQVIGLVELNIAGLMSSEHVDIVAAKADLILQAFRACGCTLNNPNMQLSLLGLVVIPELRISDKGLVDVNKFDLIPVLEK